MYHGKTVALIFPAYNEEENIVHAITEFQKLKFIDEIIVVDNNSKDQTAELARKSRAKVVPEKQQGYGFALRKGFSLAHADYIVLAEPDGTFDANDLPKLLQQIEHFDVVIGTRTNRAFIEPGANMSFFLRSGNVVVAKILQFLFAATALTDCGCTFRVFKKEVVEKIRPHFTVGGSYFLPETVILTTQFGFSMTEIPVHYRQRVGQSKITGSMIRSVQVGLAMLKLILRYRLFFQTSSKL